MNVLNSYIFIHTLSTYNSIYYKTNDSATSILDYFGEYMLLKYCARDVFDRVKETSSATLINCT